MTERSKIVELDRSGRSVALVSLVRVEGSSYRRPGAHLLISDSGFAGTISGGCLEAEVIRKAAWNVRAGAALERYSTLFDDTAEIPYGLGCGGTVTLLFEPAGTAEYRAVMQALDASLRGEFRTVVTWLPTGTPAPQAFARAVLSSAGDVLFASSSVTSEKIALAMQGMRHADTLSNIFVEHLTPPQRLVIFGAGDDAKPLVSLAALLGWNVQVVDGRPQLARPERFPGALSVLTLTPGEVAPLNLSSADAVVLMTHSYEQDRDWLAAVLPIAPIYFGVLGAKHRSSLLVSEAASATGLSLAACCERIYAPVGLDLGGDGPEAIALAVLSEAHARCMGRLGSSLRLSAEDVAAQIELHSKPARPAFCALDSSLIV